ncbi:hypothetical protein MNQ98_02700 [Paenibacillus sp. N3/727]|uniref:hypothetical protein n=1 Tax=Paenibacillus sp. N3/727 TaxID=2925845 RepID=UPI001F52F7E9|nr:hypothetical protein [Paenibacillus sp. N3/727]UNK18975.1 hypothetical protein MNQ98_02700 [Paenibacillus sp. N3/727]
MNFQKWDMGSKMIFIATCAAIISFFFKWVDVGFVSENGFGQGAVFFILLFLYPFLMVIREKRMNKMLGYVMAIVGIILSYIYVLSKSVDILGSNFNAASSGPYLFMAACGLLLLGVHKRRS